MQIQGIRQKSTRRHVQKYTSVYIFELRVCKANTLLTRITAIHGGNENRRRRYEARAQINRRLLLETTAIHGGNDTLRTVFSSGMDAACDNQKRCFGIAESRSQNYTWMYSFGADAPYIFKRYDCSYF